jgi:hypothetical protein
VHQAGMLCTKQVCCPPGKGGGCSQHVSCNVIRRIWPRIDRTQKSSGALRASPTECPAFGSGLHARSSPWGPASASRARRCPGSKRRKVHSPQAGDSLGTKDAPSRVIRRWKAPRVQPMAFPFAGDREKRPCKARSATRNAPGELVKGPRFIRRPGDAGYSSRHHHVLAT